MIKSLCQSYTNYIIAKPLFGRMVTTGILVGVGDTLCQTLVEKRSFNQKDENPFDYKRLLRANALGFCFIAPNLYFWYNKIFPKILARQFFQKMNPYKRNLAGAALDQTTFAFYIVSNYMFWVSMLEFQDRAKAFQNVKEK